MAATSICDASGVDNLLARWNAKDKEVNKLASQFSRATCRSKSKDDLSMVYRKYLNAYHDLKCDVHMEIYMRESYGRKEDPSFSHAKLFWSEKLKTSHRIIKQIAKGTPFFRSQLSVDLQAKICQSSYQQFKESYDAIETKSCRGSDLYKCIRSYQSLKTNLKLLRESVRSKDPRRLTVVQLIQNINELKQRIPLVLSSVPKGADQASAAVERRRIVSLPQIPKREASKPSERAMTWKREALSPSELANAQSQLREGIRMEVPVINEIQKNLSRIMKKKPGNGVVFYQSQPQHSVFSLEREPRFIFKVLREDAAQISGKDNSMKARFNLMVYAKAICMKYGLKHLVIPQAALIQVPHEGKVYEVLVEQRLEFDPHLSKQEELFNTLEDRLSPAIREFAEFICRTGYHDVEPRNHPVIQSDGSLEHCQIGIIDCEFMGEPHEGLYGGLGQGLVHLVGLKQMKSIQKIAAVHHLDSQESYQKAVALCKEKNEDEKRLAAFYVQKGIERGDEMLEVDPASLDFSSHPLTPGKQLPVDVARRIQRFALKVISKINEEISTKSPGETVAGRRLVKLDTHHDVFNAYSTTVVDQDVYEAYQAKQITDAQYYEATVLGYVVQKLVDLGLVFKVKSRNDGGYLLQA